MTEEQLRQVVAELPRALAGQRAGAEARAVARAVLEAVGIEALAIIKEAYIDKSRHGTDAAGVKWRPLSPATLAYRRRHPRLTRQRGRARRAGRAKRPLLTAVQDRTWRRIYVAMLHRKKTAKEAAMLAWAVVKRMGGRTVKAVYGAVGYEIGRDTGRLLNSLSPGAPQNILRVRVGQAVVGTNVAYADAFAAVRPFIPENWPDVWQERIARVMADTIAVALGGTVT